MQYITARQFHFALLAGLLLTFSFLASGCKTLQNICFGTKSSPPLPIIFATTPTLEQAKLEINRRYASIMSISTNDATISGSFSPISLRSCSIAFEKPKRLRILARAAVGMGTEVDIGSNDELFWFWIKRAEPKEIYYAYHQQFAASPVRSMIPIEPEWLLETIGLIELKDTDIHEGPTRVEDGYLQVTSKLQTPRGVYSRILTFHPQTGAFMKYEIYAPNGRPFIGATMSDHMVDPLHGILYAKKITITCPDANATLNINLGNVKFNTTGGASPDAFSIPRYDEYIPRDLCGRDFQQMMQQQQQNVPPITPFHHPAPNSGDDPVPAGQRYVPYSGSDTTAGSSASTATYFRSGNF